MGGTCVVDEVGKPFFGRVLLHHCDVQRVVTLKRTGVYCVRASLCLWAPVCVPTGVQANPHLKLMGTPELSVVCFNTVTPGLSVYAVADGMTARGWNLNLLQFPSCAHICVTYKNSSSADLFVEHLNAAVIDALAAPGTSSLASEGNEGTGQLTRLTPPVSY